jgi:hypothetical protein
MGNRGVDLAQTADEKALLGWARTIKEWLEAPLGDDPEEVTITVTSTGDRLILQRRRAEPLPRSPLSKGSPEAPE